jgi:hypothetical protein
VLISGVPPNTPTPTPWSFGCIVPVSNRFPPVGRDGNCLRRIVDGRRRIAETAAIEPAAVEAGGSDGNRGVSCCAVDWHGKADGDKKYRKDLR